MNAEMHEAINIIFVVLFNISTKMPKIFWFFTRFVRHYLVQQLSDRSLSATYLWAIWRIELLILFAPGDRIADSPVRCSVLHILASKYPFWRDVCCLMEILREMKTNWTHFDSVARIDCWNYNAIINNENRKPFMQFVRNRSTQYDETQLNLTKPGRASDQHKPVFMLFRVI